MKLRWEEKSRAIGGKSQKREEMIVLISDEAEGEFKCKNIKYREHYLWRYVISLYVPHNIAVKYKT